MDIKTRIINFLAEGLKPSQIASIVGCSAGYVTQIAKDPASAAQIATKIAEESATKTEEDMLHTKYTALEHALLQQMEVAMAGAELRDLTGALKAVGERQENRMRRLQAPTLARLSAPRMSVSVTLPGHALQNMPAFTLNETNEIIAVEGQALAPLSTEGVRSLFTQHKEQKTLPAPELQPLPESTQYADF